VIAAKARRLGLMNKTQQDAPLTSLGRKSIEPGQMKTASGGPHRLRHPPDQQTICHPSLDATPVHALLKSVISDALTAFVKRVGRLEEE
jgi:hypothetical protein